MDQQAETDVLKKELYGLFKYMKRVREEIAAINRPADEALHFDNMSDQLDAIVQATEEATNTIMGAMEKNDDIVTKLRENITDADQLALLDRISANGADVFEACSFQDITGQRISKVVKSVTYVEDRVNTLIEVWGKEEIDKIDVKPDREKTADEKLLQGPSFKSMTRVFSGSAAVASPPIARAPRKTARMMNFKRPIVSPNRTACRSHPG